MLSKIVGVSALSIGLAAGFTGAAGADPIVPGPTSVGPFTQTGEPTGRAACDQASIDTGNFSACFEYPDGSGNWYYTPSN